MTYDNIRSHKKLKREVSPSLWKIHFSKTLSRFRVKVNFGKFFRRAAEAYSEPCQTSKIEYFAKIINGLKAVKSRFAKRSILDI